jgi:hypothetical protein
VEPKWKGVILTLNLKVQGKCKGITGWLGLAKGVTGHDWLAMTGSVRQYGDVVCLCASRLSRDDPQQVNHI